jgi:hypothetical protein
MNNPPAFPSEGYDVPKPRHGYCKAVGAARVMVSHIVEVCFQQKEGDYQNRFSIQLAQQKNEKAYRTAEGELTHWQTQC